MARRGEESAALSRSVAERREAYFTALRAADLNLRRKRYARQGKAAKLAEIEQTWTKSERVRLEMDAGIAVATFGSPRARELMAAWNRASNDEDEQQMRTAYLAFVDLARQELGRLPQDP
ncbi:hypothetical protein [Nocardia iowensis]|uniref:Uncharacterized protein n=1 Tax=Nocardia iowensis TaxID=204891 RepID=A0ABX8RXV1_NOCIO|nr:hypothetical protein [Nocardia iowensis]QXN94494.1 hypothetical protein KV110_16445 [Nocardia iowensis]